MFKFLKRFCLTCPITKDLKSDFRELNEQYYDLKKSIEAVREHTSTSFDEVIETFKEQLKEETRRANFFSASLETIGDVLPDMIWMKWKDGKYAYANRAIKEELLFDDCPLGKNDVIIGTNAQKFFGGNKHNFGAYCAGSDDVTIELGHRKRFIEYGLSGGKPLVLEVYKNVVRDNKKDIIATVGCGRDITDNIFTMFQLQELAEGTDLVQSQEVIRKYLDKYLFENDHIPETLKDFYHNNKDAYYGRQ